MYKNEMFHLFQIKFLDEIQQKKSILIKIKMLFKCVIILTCYKVSTLFKSANAFFKRVVKVSSPSRNHFLGS